MSLADLLTFGFYSEEGAIADQCNTPYSMIQDIQHTKWLYLYHSVTEMLSYMCVWPPGSSWGPQYIIGISIRNLELLFTSMKGQQWVSFYHSIFHSCQMCVLISLPRSALNKTIHFHFCIMLWWHFKAPKFGTTCTQCRHSSVLINK